jgi:hypothetical protein
MQPEHGGGFANSANRVLHTIFTAIARPAHSPTLLLIGN